MNTDKYKINKLRRLLGYLNNFQKDYERVIKISKNIHDINKLGSMNEYPFDNSLDNIDVKKWIKKFKTNIENEIEEIIKDNMGDAK